MVINLVGSLENLYEYPFILTVSAYFSIGKRVIYINIYFDSEYYIKIIHFHFTNKQDY